MPRLSCGLSLAALLVACNGGIGVTDASSYTSTTSQPSTTSASGSPTTGDDGGSGSGSGSGASTTSTSTSTGGADGSGSSGTPVTTAPTSGPATGSSSSGGDPSTGEPVGCVDVSGDYGACDLFLGYGFDGTSCRGFSGCNCAPNCEHFAASPVACASSCAAAGECNEAAIHAAALAMEPVQVGSFCDEVDACAEKNSEAAGWLAGLYPGVPCEGGNFCKMGQPCVLQLQGMIDAGQWEQLCAASLLPGAELYCVVYGP